MQRPGVTSRREFLRLATLGAGSAALLAACSQPTAPSPTPAPAKPAEPTKPAAAAAPTTAPAKPTVPVAAKATTAPASTKTKKVSFATDWNAGVRLDTIKAALAEYQKRRPEIAVEALHLGSGSGTSSVGGFSEQIVAMFIGGTAPDVVFSWIEIVGTYRSFLADLTPLLKAKNYSQLGIVEIPANTHWEGKQYGVNFAPATGGWLYNATMFEKAGVPLPTDGWTWDDALDAMKKLTKPAEKQYGFWSRNYSEYGYLPLVESNGGRHFADNAYKKVALCEPNGTEAFQWWVDLIHKHKVSPEAGVAAGMKTAETSDLFSLGLVAMSASPLQSVGNYTKFIGNRFKWGLMPYPRAPQTKDRKYLVHTEPLVVPKDAQKRGTEDAAVDLSLFMAGDDFVQKFIAENRPTIPVKKSIFTSPEYTKGPPDNMAQIGKQLQDGERHYQTRPLTKWWAEFTQKLTAATDKAIIGEASAADAWKEACQVCQRVVDSAS